MDDNRRLEDNHIAEIRAEIRALAELIKANTNATADIAQSVEGLVAAWQAGRWFLQFVKVGAAIALGVTALLSWLQGKHL